MNLQKMNTLKHITYTLLITVITYFTAVADAVPKLSPGAIGGKSFILVETNSNTVLAEYRANEKLEPASITKLMTAYVVYQSIANGLISLDDKTVISAQARNMGGSRMFLEQGSHVSIDNLLSGLVIQSGNDAAIALAEAVAGDESRFVELMNKQAHALGMLNTQFKNVSGMPTEGHYTTARDIAILARAIIYDFPEHYGRYSKKSFTWNNITQENRNSLLYKNPNVDGLKTGHTEAAGYCLAASAKRGNMRLISVVLGTQSNRARTQASNSLLNYGFDNFSNQKLYSAGQKIVDTNVQNGTQKQVAIAITKDVVLTLPRVNPKQGLQAKLQLDKPLIAPLTKGTILGRINIEKDGKQLTSVPAIATQDIEELGFFSKLWRIITE